MIDNKTIIAQITCPGRSAVGIIRISGCHAKKVAIKVLGKIPLPRFAVYLEFLDENKKILDKGLVLWFPSPHSFTGEDVLELQGHGSPIIMDLLIKRILSIDNIRMANPGEFSERAFLNGKIDLIQAEAIDDLINAETSLSVRASLNSLQGHFSTFIKEILNIIIECQINVESSIDFSEDEINIDIEHVINSKFKDLHHKFLELKNIVAEGSILKAGKKIVIAGPPNAGKSSLLNILSHHERAIVTHLPGTTRDLLYEHVNINGVVCELIDTAGLRNTNNKIERIGIKRAWKEIRRSDHVLFVIDKTIKQSKRKKLCDAFMKNILDKNIQVTFVLNKNDLMDDKPIIETIEDWTFIHISARTGKGIDILRKHIIDIKINNNQESIFIARRRHIHQVDLAYNELLLAKKNWICFKNIELLAESLRIMNRYLGEITGKYTSEDLLNRIFSSFCIGK